MYIVSNLLLYVLFGVRNAIMYYYYCRMSETSFKWLPGIVYALLSIGTAFAFYRLNIYWEFTNMLAGTALFTVCVMFFQKARFKDALITCSLALCVQSIIGGVMQSIAFWIVSALNTRLVYMLADIVTNTFVIALLILTFRTILYFFSGIPRNIRGPSLLIRLIPVLFITFVGVILSDAIYGNTVIIHSVHGLIEAPKLTSQPMLFLRLLSYGALLFTLYAHKRLTQSIKHEQTIELLEQQARNQQTYVKEARERYEQTRSFRHDIKNHLLILRQLLTDGNADAARDYLGKLEGISDALSFPIQTGNSAADALLGSKLAIAANKGIRVDCELYIPKQSGVDDLDWCIVLSNALDNAITANDSISGQDKMIFLRGSQKGNIYLLHLENRCPPGTKKPKAGIGLSNISAVLEKYNGKSDIEINGDIFVFDAMFVIPQQ